MAGKSSSRALGRDAANSKPEAGYSKAGYSKDCPVAANRATPPI
ncbi:hypothetical protein EDE12_103111 [Methylosinus sp. sav-2]|nr:hypothetical protein EDE12_103111 [Methylosinus sp. sav-2]